MNKNRLEAFSDGVLAIILTIMVLELRPPAAFDWPALCSMWPKFLSYILSFVYVAIYWNNHHHLFQLVRQVRGAVLWANMNLLFWLSLVPFVTAWSEDSHFAAIPVATYGGVLFMASVSYYLLVRVLLSSQESKSELATAIGGDLKGKISTLLYAVAIALTSVTPYAALGIYVLVAIVWLVPDSRVEKTVVRKAL